VHVLEIGHRHRLAHVQEIDRLAAGHPGRPCRFGQHQARAARIGQARRVQHRERLRLQRVAREQRHGLAERDVARRLAAAEHVVVHARQVVVHERIGVDHFHRRRRRVDNRGIRIGELARGVGEKRPHALAAAQHGVAHRLDQRRRPAVDARQRTVEHVLDSLLPFAGPDRECEVRLHRPRCPARTI
jgi:hypothetical protein